MTEHTSSWLSDADLAALRREADLTQTGRAQAAGIGRHAVSHWKGEDVVDARHHAPQHMRVEAGISDIHAVFRKAIARAGAPAWDGVLVAGREQQTWERLEPQHDVEPVGGACGSTVHGC
ncbi:hypothetical protein [Rubellimicrobium roseum]|uniref:Helix-turn-helix domain-containing protein n=1 Tax=Rubellimicrobium roseum TaxID=687525 RepID=A0A5C4N7F6_9RHOB|nr:hypothetical protein [Rubellimicrobium roseum]TNC63113.1 hypothetical protein FHG71_19700 [Rubellimicrobium roseum]